MLKKNPKVLAHIQNRDVDSLYDFASKVSQEKQEAPLTEEPTPKVYVLMLDMEHNSTPVLGVYREMSKAKEALNKELTRLKALATYKEGEIKEHPKEYVQKGTLLMYYDWVGYHDLVILELDVQ